VALLAALWLVVAIATVATQFALEARERRTLGLLAAERGVQRAAAQGALALIQAKLEYALRVAPTGANVAQLRAGDPWMDVDSAYTGTFYVDSMPVEVVAHDLNEKLNVNLLTENDLRTFFSFVLNDYSKATQLAQTIMDWRDADSIPRPSGAERDAYLKAGMLALPANAPFREIDDLRDMMGMTPEIYAAVVPYLTTRGSGAVNVNTAPVAVLRALPGMTDATINQILQQRSQGRRIDNLAQITGETRRNGRPLPGQLSQAQLQTALAGRIVYRTREVELTLTARVGPQAQPSRLSVVLSNQGNNANVSFKEW
jgi:general secretion pathway protein K